MTTDITYKGKTILEGPAAAAVIFGFIALIFLSGFFCGVALS